ATQGAKNNHKVPTGYVMLLARSNMKSRATILRLVEALEVLHFTNFLMSERTLLTFVGAFLSRDKHRSPGST
ncbi:hypothetical protein HAX54_019571, partial [Datura stramonium]|nr:hypothetical protein [Datura stramonium]